MSLRICKKFDDCRPAHFKWKFFNEFECITKEHVELYPQKLYVTTKNVNKLDLCTRILI